jgi:long-chain fatty acid transport protein
MSVAALYVDDMVEDKQRTMTLRLDSLWSVGAAAEWQWTEKRAIQIGLSYISLGDAPVTTPEIPGLGSLSGEYTSRELIFLRVGMSVGAL